MDLATILDDCVHRMRAGETVEDCLAAYPDHAAELAPMLRAASILQLLAGWRLPDAYRQETRGVLRREAAASRARPKRSRWTAFWLGPAARAFAGGAAAVVFLTFAISTVTASQPGDLTYPARVIAEHTTVLLQRTPDGRARTSLRLADSRLSDLEAGLALPGPAYDRALDALLQEDKALADLTPRLSGAERERIAARLAAHAGQLAALAGAHQEPKAASALRRAADETKVLADRMLADAEMVAPAPGGANPVPGITETVPTPVVRTPAAKAPGNGLSRAGVPTKPVSAGRGRLTGVRFMGVFRRPGDGAGQVVAGLRATNTPSAGLLDGPKPGKGMIVAASPEHETTDRPVRAGFQGGTVEKSRPPARPKPSAAEALKAETLPVATPVVTAVPASHAQGDGRIVSPSAIAPARLAPGASGPGARGLAAGKAAHPIGMALAAEPGAAEGSHGLAAGKDGVAGQPAPASDKTRSRP